MKKLVWSLFAFTIAITILAQEKPRIKEIGIVFSNLEIFGLSFKIGKEKALWRINTLLIDGGNLEETMDSVVSKTSSIGFMFGVGREYRKAIAKNLELRYGAEILPYFSYTFGSMVEEFSDE